MGIIWCYDSSEPRIKKTSDLVKSFGYVPERLLVYDGDHIYRPSWESGINKFLESVNGGQNLLLANGFAYDADYAIMQAAESLKEKDRDPAKTIIVVGPGNSGIMDIVQLYKIPNVAHTGGGHIDINNKSKVQELKKILSGVLTNSKTSSGNS